MEKYFDIRYEFDVPTVHKSIGEHATTGKPGYICVADGNILTMVHNDEEYRNIIDGSMFSICDSSWVPKFVKRIYGYERSHYCGSDIFKEPKKQIRRCRGIVTTLPKIFWKEKKNHKQ